MSLAALFSLFFFNDTAPTEIYTLSLHDALPISHDGRRTASRSRSGARAVSRAASFSSRSEERFSRNAETDIVCRLLLGKNGGGRRTARRTADRHCTDSRTPQSAARCA